MEEFTSMVELHPTDKRAIQEFEDAVIKKATAKYLCKEDWMVIEQKYVNTKKNLIELITSMYHEK